MEHELFQARSESPLREHRHRANPTPAEPEEDAWDRDARGKSTATTPLGADLQKLSDLVQALRLASRTIFHSCGLVHPRAPAMRDSRDWSRFGQETRRRSCLWCARRMRDLAHVSRRRALRWYRV